MFWILPSHTDERFLIRSVGRQELLPSSRPSKYPLQSSRQKDNNNLEISND